MTPALALSVALSIIQPHWPPYYPAELGNSITAISDNGSLIELPRGYIMHRDDAERFVENMDQLNECMDEIENKPFFDSTFGKVLLFGGWVFAGGILSAIVLAGT